MEDVNSCVHTRRLMHTCGDMWKKMHTCGEFLFEVTEVGGTVFKFVRTFFATDFILPFSFLVIQLFLTNYVSFGALN